MHDKKSIQFRYCKHIYRRYPNRRFIASNVNCRCEFELVHTHRGSLFNDSNWIKIYFRKLIYMYPIAANHGPSGLTRDRALWTPDRGLRRCMHILSSRVCNSWKLLWSLTLKQVGLVRMCIFNFYYITFTPICL